MNKFAYKWTLAGIATLLTVVTVGCGALPTDILPDENTPSVNTESTSPATVDANNAPEAATNNCLGLDDPTDDIHQAVMDNLNNFRIANGLEPLIYSVKLQAAADAQVRDLYERNFFAHINPDGLNPGQRAVAAGFCHEYVGENLAAGQKTPDAAQVAWENSPSHRQNMLEPGYKYVGIGVYQDPTGRYYWAQELAYHVP